jgi:hypothetical protein
MSACSGKKVETLREESRLSEQDVRLLLIVCSELVRLSASVTERISPPAAAMLKYVRDDIRFESKVGLPYS